MNFALNIQQPDYLLEKADIIVYEPKTINKFYDTYEKYQDKEYIFKYRSATQLTDDIVEEIHSHAKILKDKLLIMGLPMIPSFSGLNVCPFSRGKNCDSFNALNWWHQNGIKNIIVGDPLFFQLPDAKKYYPDVKIYCIPNDLRQGLYSAGKPDDMWIQPECIDKYEGLIDVIFFEAETVNQEEALFKIYAQEKRWAGNFNILMPTSLYDCNNAFIPPEVTDSRLTCQHRCLKTHNCHICQTAIMTADYEKIKKAYEEQNE